MQLRKDREPAWLGSCRAWALVVLQSGVFYEERSRGWWVTEGGALQSERQPGAGCGPGPQSVLAAAGAGELRLCLDHQVAVWKLELPVGGLGHWRGLHVAASGLSPS